MKSGQKFEATLGWEAGCVSVYNCNAFWKLTLFRQRFHLACTCPQSRQCVPWPWQWRHLLAGVSGALDSIVPIRARVLSLNLDGQQLLQWHRQGSDLVGNASTHTACSMLSESATQVTPTNSLKQKICFLPNMQMLHIVFDCTAPQLTEWDLALEGDTCRRIVPSDNTLVELVPFSFPLNYLFFIIRPFGIRSWVQRYRYDMGHLAFQNINPQLSGHFRFLN